MEARGKPSRASTIFARPQKSHENSSDLRDASHYHYPLMTTEMGRCTGCGRNNTHLGSDMNLVSYLTLSMQATPILQIKTWIK